MKENVLGFLRCDPMEFPIVLRISGIPVETRASQQRVGYQYTMNIHIFSSCAPGYLVELRNQESCMLAVFFEGLPELRGQHRFFFSRFDPIAQNDQGGSRDTSPFVDGQNSAKHCQIQTGVDGMAEMSVGAGADELVSFFQGDSGAPVLSQMASGPQRDRDAGPG